MTGSGTGLGWWPRDMTVSPCRLVGLTQEHGLLEHADGQMDFGKFPVGSVLALIPYHVSAVPHPLVPSVTPCVTLLSPTGVCYGGHAPCVLRARGGAGGGPMAPRAWLVGPHPTAHNEDLHPQ